MIARDLNPGELDRIRRALQAAVDGTSLRAVAAAVEMSPSGLSKLLAGGEPYGKTVERIRRWYEREAGLDRVAPHVLAERLRLLVPTLSSPDRGVVMLLEAVDRSYEAESLPAPEWTRRVRVELEIEPRA